MGKIINPALIGNWENWVRIFLLVAIGSLVIHYTGQMFNRKEGK